jgi:large subunit ribosomal protein L25
VRFDIQCEAREARGRSENRRLRRLGKVPAVIYGGGKDASAVTLDHNLLERHMKHPAFYTSVLTVKLDSETHAVIVKDVQRHPARPEVMHLDFQRIVEDEELTLHVPIHFLGEEVAKGVKEQGGVIEHLATDLEISCLPKHLPEFIEVDVTQLEMNDVLHLSDLKLPEGVKLVALEHDQDRAVVTVSQPRREEVEAEGEGDGEGADGEAPAAEESKPEE